MPLTVCGRRVPSLDQRNLCASHVGMISAGGEFRFSYFDAPLQASAEISTAAARPQDSAAGSTAVLLLSVSCPPQALAPIPAPSPFSAEGPDRFEALRAELDQLLRASKRLRIG